MSARAAYDWPAAMPGHVAAEYVGLKSETTLRRIGPAPRHIGSRVVWLRAELDRWLDALPKTAGDSTPEPPAVNPWG